MVFRQGIGLALVGAAVGLVGALICVAPDGGIALRRFAQRSTLHAIARCSSVEPASPNSALHQATFNSS